MEAETRMATPRQLAYIERLGTGTGATRAKPIGELTMTEAWELIADFYFLNNHFQILCQNFLDSQLPFLYVHPTPKRVFIKQSFLLKRPYPFPEGGYSKGESNGSCRK
jgi:hypothetical protein